MPRLGRRSRPTPEHRGQVRVGGGLGGIVGAVRIRAVRSGAGRERAAGVDQVSGVAQGAPGGLGNHAAR